jgi:hypothetical protein
LGGIVDGATEFATADHEGLVAPANEATRMAERGVHRRGERKRGRGLAIRKTCPTSQDNDLDEDDEVGRRFRESDVDCPDDAG